MRGKRRRRRRKRGQVGGAIDVVNISFLLVVTMADRVSFSPVKRVLTFSLTDSASKVGKSKKKRSVTMREELPLGALRAISDTVPLVDNSSKGNPSLMKAIRKLKIKKKKF